MSRLTSLFVATALSLAWLHANVADAQNGVLWRVRQESRCKIAEVAFVDAVQPNVQTETIMVIAKPQAVLSPRALWEAVEQAGQRPTKLEGPSGTFSTKPQF